MAQTIVIVEGSLKYRDGRKVCMGTASHSLVIPLFIAGLTTVLQWKSRWAVVTKLSPVADCLHLQIYRDSKDRCKSASTKSSLSLDGFLAMETGFTLEKESNTIAVICRELVVLLAFDTRELLIQWQVKIKAHLCQEQHFLVQITSIPSKSKLSCGPARLHLQDHHFCLVSGIPPRLLYFWPIKELRRFGVVDGKFCFEGGSSCGKGAGLHVLLTNQSEELAKCFELALNGRLHEKRRLSSKNFSIDGSVRMSLQQSKCHKSCECGSNESSRPLISSGSESSVCDACSEIIRFNDISNGSHEDNDLMLSSESDEHYSSRSTCSTILRCSSTLSCHRMPAYIPAANADSDIFLSSHSIVNNCVDNRCSLQGLSNIESNTLPKCALNDNSRCSWSLSACAQCGHHFYPDIYCCSSNDVLSTKTLTNNAISELNLTEFRSISPSTSLRDCFRHNSHTLNIMNKTGGTVLTDRTSLCSQSSHSSGASNSSNGSNGSHSSGNSCHCTEYSVPRPHPKPALILDTLYDKPKNIQHKICNQMIKRDVISNACSCHSNQMDVNNKNLLNCGHCPTLTKHSHLSDNCCHFAETHPKEILNNKIVNDLSEQHYAVPRTALANMYLKELKASQNSLREHSAKNMIDICGQEYDIPRKFKESLIQPPNQSICSCAVPSVPSAQPNRAANSWLDANALNSDLSNDTNRTANNNTQLLTNNCHRILVKPINQYMVSLSHNCQPKSVADESELVLTPLPLQRVETISRQMQCTTDKRLPLADNCSNCCPTVGQNTVIDKTCETDETEEKCNGSERTPNAVNGEQKKTLSDCKQSMANQSTSRANVNYVNMHFVRSIPLYQNIEFRQTNRNLINGSPSDGSASLSGRLMNEEKCLHLQCSSSVTELSDKSMDPSLDDYMLMQPIISSETTLKYPNQSPHQSMQTISANPSNQHLIETVNSDNDLNNGIHSLSTNHLNTRLTYLRRSNSSERLRENNFLVSTPNQWSCPPSPSLTAHSKRQLAVVSKMLYKSKEKSFSIDDISSAQLSRTQTHCLKTSHRLAPHKSADCLKHRSEEYRSSDEDLCTSSQITVLCATPALSTLRTELLADKDVIDSVTHLQKGSANGIHSPSSGYESEKSFV